MRKIFVALMILLLLCSLAQGNSRYQYFAVDSYKSKYYFDTQSISFTNKKDVIRFWEKTALTNAGQKAMINNTQDNSLKNVIRKTSEIMQCVEIDFDKNAYRVINSIYYSSKGQVLSSYNSNFLDFESWSYIPPGSIIEAARDAIKSIIQASHYGKAPQQPVNQLPQIPLYTPQQRQEYKQLQEYNTWIATQSDFPDFQRWFEIKARTEGTTPQELNLRLVQHVQNGGSYTDVQRVISGWYSEFQREKYIYRK